MKRLGDGTGFRRDGKVRGKSKGERGKHRSGVTSGSRRDWRTP